MMKRQKELLALACAAYIGLMLVALTGCATLKDIHQETKGVVEDVYASVRIAEALQAEAVAVAHSPTTPDSVVYKLAVASQALTLSCESAAKSAKIYEDALALANSLPAGTPEAVDALNKANVAAAASRQFVSEVIAPAIDSFRALIASAKKGA